MLHGKKLDGPLRPATVHHSVNGTFAIRQGDWKLILGLGSRGFSTPRNEKPKEGGPRGQLYNLADDPTESKNLWLANPDKVTELTSVLEGIKKSGRSRP